VVFGSCDVQRRTTFFFFARSSKTSGSRSPTHRCVRFAAGWCVFNSAGMTQPPPAPPNFPPSAPSLLHGSVAATLLLSTVGAAALFSIFFVVRVGEQRPEWRPPASAGVTALRVSPTFRGRLRLLAAAVLATDEEVAARCGADALAALRCNRTCAAVLACAALPALCCLLPLCLAAGGDAAGFARTTVANARELSAALSWAMVVSAVCSAAAVAAAAAVLDAQLRGIRLAEDSPASLTLLVRGMARDCAGPDVADELKAKLDERVPGSVHAVFVPRDSRAERELERKLAACSGARRAHLEARLEALRAQPPRGAGIAFLVCLSPLHASRVLSELAPFRVRGVLGDVLATVSNGRGPLPWRADWAPPPEAIYADNIGLGAYGRAARTLSVNIVVFLVLVVVACPSVLAVVSFDAAAVGVRQRWQHFLSRAGLGAGLLLQWVPTLASLVFMQHLLPWLLAWATRRERHLSVGSEARALLTKSVQFNTLNVLIVLAFGRAALAAALQLLLECHWAHATGQECSARFMSLLRKVYVANSAAAVISLLALSIFWITLELLQWREAVRNLFRRLLQRRQSAVGAPLLDEPDRHDSDAAPASLALSSKNIFGSAYNVCIFTVALCYSTVAPLTVIPGILYFLARCAADKWNMLAALPSATRPPSDGSLARTVVFLLRAASLLHVAALATYMHGRHGEGLQFAALAALAAVLLIRVLAAVVFEANVQPKLEEPGTPNAVAEAALLARATAAYARIADAGSGAELLPNNATDAPHFQFRSY